MGVVTFTWSILRPHRSTTYVDAAYCYQPSSVVCLSVCLSHIVRPAKTAAPIEMPFGIDREFEFYDFFSFVKFNEFYEFFSVEKKSQKIRNFANHSCLTCFDVLECNVHL